MKRKLQVFVSSTYTDLREERQAAVMAILRQGHIPAGMELFAAGDEEQLKVIRRWIDESDVFMLLLGKRYGSIDLHTGVGYTELEYRHAIETGKPFFSVVLSREFANAKVHRGAQVESIYEQAYPSQFLMFEKTVLSRMCRIVDDQRDIQMAVSDSLRAIEQRNDLAGWLPAHSVVNRNASIFRNLSQGDYAKALDEDLYTATSVDVVGIGNNALTQEKTVEYYREFVARGGRMRILFLAPWSEAIRSREVAEGRLQGSLKFNVVHNVEDIRRFIEHTRADPLTITVRFYSYAPSLNLIAIGTRVAYVRYYGHQHRGQDAPCIVVTDPELVSYYQNEFDRMWNNAEPLDWEDWVSRLGGTTDGP